MKLSQANEYLQTIATIGAIVGLLIVGYEIRQSNEFATQQTKSQYWTNWMELASNTLSSDIHTVLAKTLQEPESLTLFEQMKVDDYYWSHLSAWSHGVLTYDYTSSEMEKKILSALELAAPATFLGSYGRTWFEVNKGQLEQPIAEAIERGLRASSSNVQDYYKLLKKEAMQAD